MNHSTTKRFWDCYAALPEDVQQLADKSYELLKVDPKHPSLHFKKLGNVWSARVGLHYRDASKITELNQAIKAAFDVP